MITKDPKTKPELLRELKAARAEIKALEKTLGDFSNSQEQPPHGKPEIADIYRYILSTSPDLMSFLSTDFHYVLVNDAYLRISGLGRNEIEGRLVSEFMGQDRYEHAIKPRLERCLQGETIRYSEWFDYKALGKRFMYVTYTPCLGPGGGVIGIAVNARDITERVKAQEALLKSEELLSMAQRISKVGGWFREFPDGMTYWTDEHFRILGYDPGAIVPSKDVFMSHVHPDDRAAIDNNRKAALAGRSDFDVEYRFFRTDGQLRHGRTLGKVQMGPDGSPLFMFGAIQDISDRKLIEQSLANALAEKEAMLLEIHHRVKNNLQVMMSLLDMSRNRARGDEAKAVIEEVITKITSMILIHNKLYRMDDLKHIDIGDFAATLCANLAEVYARPDVTQEMDAAHVLLSIENAMPVGLVLNEIISNAYKHAFGCGKGVIRVSVRREGSSVRVQVADNGSGLPPGFDPATTKTLGLKLVRDLVEIRLGGTLKITNDKGTVATFRFNESCSA